MKGKTLGKIGLWILFIGFLVITLFFALNSSNLFFCFRIFEAIYPGMVYVLTSLLISLICGIISIKTKRKTLSIILGVICILFALLFIFWYFLGCFAYGMGW